MHQSSLKTLKSGKMTRGTWSQYGITTKDVKEMTNDKGFQGMPNKH